MVEGAGNMHDLMELSNLIPAGRRWKGLWSDVPAASPLNPRVIKERKTTSSALSLSPEGAAL